MLRLIHLLLPALIPSWRFFKAIGPSPRLEWTWAGAARWQPFRPRPQKLSVARMVLRLLWNPRWNEGLYLVSCAERLTGHDSLHALREIQTRLGSELASGAQGRAVQFRLVFVHKQAGAVIRTVTYQSAPFAVPVAKGV